VCVLAWVSAQTRFQVPWGSSLALPYGSERAPHSQKDPGNLQLPPCFYCAPLAGSAAEAMLRQIRDLFSCFRAAVVPRGYSCCPGLAGRTLASPAEQLQPGCWQLPIPSAEVSPLLLGATKGRGSVRPSTLLQTQIGAHEGPACAHSYMYCSVVVVYEISSPVTRSVGAAFPCGVLAV